MAINSKVAAAKKAVKPKSKKTWADNQNPPQSKSYKSAADALVKAKPVGWRWTELGAARLGKKTSTKPSTADIEKYKSKVFTKGGVEHRYLYSEARADKSDNSQTTKLKTGGRTKLVIPSGQNPPQSKSYKEETDKTVAAKPVGWRWTSYGAHKLGKNEEVKPSADDIEQYKNKTFKLRGASVRYLYPERRIDKSDTNRKKRFAAGGQAAPQSGSYQEARDKQVHAKPIGYRFTDKRAARLHESPYEKPTAEQIEKYKDNGVYWENRKDKSDRNYTRKFEEGGMGDEEYAAGGSPKIANRDSKGYTENRYDFKGANLEGKTLTNGDYVVLSYGYYPIWFYSNATGKWYGNANGFSQTTKVQISQSRPTYNADMLQKAALEEVMHRSSLGTLYEEEKVDDNEPNV